MSMFADYRSRLMWRLVEYRIQSSPMPDLRDKQPVFLLFTPRTGSKHFLSLLESIPGARFDFEILGSVHRHAARMFFGPFYPIAKRLIADRVRQMNLGPHFLRPTYGTPIFSSKSVCLSYIGQCLQSLRSDICAVKFQYEHLQLGGVSPTDLHRAFANAKFVVLYRRSLSRQLISDVMRHLTGQAGWRTNRECRETQHTIRLDPAKVRSYFEAVRAINEEWIKLPFLADHGTVVCYEDLCENPQDTFERSIFPLLGLTPVPVVNNQFTKQTNRPIMEIVENYDEVADLLESPTSIQEFRIERSPTVKV